MEKVDKFDGSLTFVGLILESLPIDVKLGKLLILGHVFGCLDSCLIIAAALSLKSFFVREPLDHLLGYRLVGGNDLNEGILDGFGYASLGNKQLNISIR